MKIRLKRTKEKYPTELKDYAEMLVSVQPYLEKGWSVVAVELDTIHLENRNLPYRKQNKYKRMTKREQEFMKDLSWALIFKPSEIPHILKGYSDILIGIEKNKT